MRLVGLTGQCRIQGGDVCALKEQEVVMRRQDKDCAVWMWALANEEPLKVVKSCVDIMWEMVRQDA